MGMKSALFRWSRWLLVLALLRFAEDGTAGSPPPRIDPAEVTLLTAEPARLRLRPGEAGSVVITAQLKDGFEADVTGDAVLTAATPGLVDLASDGVVRAVRSGVETVAIAFGAHRIELPVEIVPPVD